MDLDFIHWLKKLAKNYVIIMVYLWKMNGFLTKLILMMDHL